MKKPTNYTPIRFTDRQKFDVELACDVTSDFNPDFLAIG